MRIKKYDSDQWFEFNEEVEKQGFGTIDKGMTLFVFDGIEDNEVGQWDYTFGGWLKIF